MFSFLFKKRSRAILEQFMGRELLAIHNGANFYGLQSKKSVRGNGILILMKDELYFGMWWPKRSYSIPISNILTVSKTRVFRGKTMFRDLLKIEFRNDEDPDTIVFLVKDIDLWITKLNELTS
ncbi:MAG: hypothetical protein INQ03_03860 [Candidatus Heimdallarchaeota archaeon]|nr:hypothetical protein [Candidatus Heimdallarchaeota archaeon]